jgi:general bacterial porin, GBP family
MNKATVAAAALASACAAPAFAQSAIRIYGILDTGPQTARLSNGARSNSLMQTAHVPTRLGFEGEEDLGDGLYAGFRLEQGFGLDTGNLLQGGRAFGREAFVSLGSRNLGEVRLGRQYAVMQVVMGVYDPDHLSPYSPVLAAQLSNLEQTSQDNVVKYKSPTFAGFTGTLLVAAGEGTAVVAANGGPQFSGAGVLRRSHGALVEYKNQGLGIAVGYQDRGVVLNAGGEVKQTMASIAALYDFELGDIGALYWKHRNELVSGRTPTTSVWTVGGSWRVTPFLRLVAQVGRASDNGMVYVTGADKARGTDTYLNLGANYVFSKRTTVYTRVGRIEDENGGFNNRPAQAAPAVGNIPGMALPANTTMKALMFGVRHRF